jgi:hypothetical protein
VITAALIYVEMPVREVITDWEEGMATIEPRTVTTALLSILIVLEAISGCSRQAFKPPVKTTAAIPPATKCSANSLKPAPMPAASTNRYVLLLFIDLQADDAVKKALDFRNWNQDTEQRGCITDPDPIGDAQTHKPFGIYVQGGCPTDCVRAVSLPTDRDNSGDPLSKEPVDSVTKKRPGWGIYYADPTGTHEAGDKTVQYSSFHVWQIFARDSCHAGTILNSLMHSTDIAIKGIFQDPKLYLGHIMIAFTPQGSPSPPPSPSPPAGHTITCKPLPASTASP